MASLMTMHVFRVKIDKFINALSVNKKESLVMKKVFSVIFILLLSTQVSAANKGQALLDKNNISIGAGFARNSIGQNNEIGGQFFAAYALDQVNLLQGVNTSVELGYLDYGFSRGNSGGLWVTGTIDGAIKGNLGWLARLGIDLGDDSGFMLGGGISYDLNAKIALRGEYVVRDDIDSIQVNIVFKL